MSRNVRYDEGTELSTEQILKTHEVPWESFTSLRLISDRDAQLIRKYDKRKRETQAELLEQVSCQPEYHARGQLFGAFLIASHTLVLQASVLRYKTDEVSAVCRTVLHIVKPSLMS